MQFATIKGSAVIAFALFVGVGPTNMGRSASGGGASESCTSASYCAPTPEPCKFAGASAVGPAVVADFPDGVSSDGRGPYLMGKDGVIDSSTGREGALTIFDRTDTVRNIRSFSVNLNKPVPGGGGVPLGIVSSGNGSGFVTQRRMVGDTVQNLMDIPVGQTDTAALMSVGFHINGRFHLLQMGPVANGHCMTDKNLVNGAGTSSGTIYRASKTKWVMDLPAGSVGRLFEMGALDTLHVKRTWEQALDKGLYYVHLHYEIGR